MTAMNFKEFFETKSSFQQSDFWRRRRKLTLELCTSTILRRQAVLCKTVLNRNCVLPQNGKIFEDESTVDSQSPSLISLYVFVWWYIRSKSKEQLNERRAGLSRIGDWRQIDYWYFGEKIPWEIKCEGTAFMQFESWLYF